MSLDLSFTQPVYAGPVVEGKPVIVEKCVGDFNITHNLNKLAAHVGIYYALWQPAVAGIECAGDLVPILRAGIAVMKNTKADCEQFDTPNGWGTYEQFVPWCEKVLAAAEEHPDASIYVSR